jgi:hypothetical protein
MERPKVESNSVPQPLPAEADSKLSRRSFVSVVPAAVLGDACRRAPQEASTGGASQREEFKDVPPQPGEDRWKFTTDLKAPMWTRHPWGSARPDPQDAVLPGRATFRFGFPDPNHRLDTAHEDLRLFLAAGNISAGDGGYTIETGQAANLAPEAFRLSVDKQGCKVLAADTEGVRRGIFCLEDQMLLRRGPFLPLGEMERRPFVRRRISRCFFGPIKRPPKMRDELMDDVDYYPEQYLNRLAHEAVNGLWLTIEFRDLCSTSFTPEAGRDAEKRLAKLRRTVGACLRYGIRTYVFSIEPRAWDADSPVLQRNPELAGAAMRDGKRYFCPATDNARKYLHESVYTIFKAVPELGGLINITHGERPTTCASALSSVGEGRVDCPRCSRVPPWQILHQSLSAMEKGMRDANPDAELISWLYMPQARGPRLNGLADWVYDIPAHTPERVILQCNFESGVSRTEFGKELVGGDYWISTPGPSARFERVAQTARQNRTLVSAKIQTGNSHEVATVPYLPVPSLLYKKFAGMHRLGVSHTMLCWYFGNYPGLMNKAAGEMSFEPFSEIPDEFLNRLASLYWGREHGPEVVQAWRHFEDGYQNYPLTNLFQYYGPMHDGPVWPLLLKPADAPLAPTWLLASTTTRVPWPPSGDRIGECFKEVLTLDEMVELARRMTTAWDRGVEILRGLEPHFANEPERLLDIGVAEALGIQFRSGYNILRFYSLREEMFRTDGPKRLDMLKQLGAIVQEELAHNERLLTLCERDSRLGFHSEAEGYKYYPEKIRWRMQQLRTVLARDVPDLEKAIRAQKPLFPEYTGRQPSGRVAYAIPSDGSLWSSPQLVPPSGLRWQPLDDGNGKPASRWAASYDSDNLYVIVSGSAAADRPTPTPLSSVLVKVEPRRLWPCKHFVYTPQSAESRVELPDQVAPQTVEGRVASGSGTWRAVVRVPLARMGIRSESLQPVRVDVRVQAAGAEASGWLPQHPVTGRLALGADNPADLGWLLFEGPQK